MFPQVNEGLLSLEELDLSCCNLTDGGLPEDIGAIPKQLHTINADWSTDSICNSLFRNISSLQHDISVSDSLSLRVFTSWLKNISSWFHHQGMGASILVNLPENWYVSDNFLPSWDLLCYSGKLIDIRAHLCDDEMTQKFALSDHSKYPACSAMHFLLVPLAGLWDASNGNGKAANNYGHFRLFSTGEKKKFGVRLLYKDESELHIGTRRSRYELHFRLFSTLKALSHSSNKGHKHKLGLYINYSFAEQTGNMFLF